MRFASAILTMIFIGFLYYYVGFVAGQDSCKEQQYQILED